MTAQTGPSTGVVIAIVTFNSRKVISAALGSAKACLDSGAATQCIIVDNQSTDGTADFVRQEFPWCSVVASPENLGFAQGCNVAIRRSTAPLILLLNPDAVLPEPDLRRLIGFLAEHPRAGAVAPAIRQPDGRLQFTCGLPTPVGFLRGVVSRAAADGTFRYIEPGEAPRPADWLCGAVVLLRRAMLDDIGLFDPGYFLYFEETDLWRRAKASSWELWTVGEAVALHIQGASAKTVKQPLYDGCIAEHFFRSRFRYLHKHFGWPAAAAVDAAEVGLLGAKALVRAMRGRRSDDFWLRLRSPMFGRGRRDTASAAERARPLV